MTIIDASKCKQTNALPDFKENTHKLKLKPGRNKADKTKQQHLSEIVIMKKLD